MPGSTASLDRTGSSVRPGRRPLVASEPRAGRWAGRAGIASACVTGVMVLAACTGSTSESPGSASPGASTTSSSGVASTPSQTAAAADPAAVESTYRQFLAVAVSFVRLPESRWRTELGRVAVDPQLSYAIAVSRMQRRNGITLYGQTKARAPRVSFSGRQKATIRDCADFSHTGQADARTGRPRTVGVARTPLVVTLLRGGDGRWRVSKVEFPGGRC